MVRKIASLTAVLFAASCGTPAPATKNATAASTGDTAAPAEDPMPPEEKAPEPEAKPEPPPPPAPPPSRLVRITVVSAEIQGRMKNGENWDGKEQSKHPPVPKPLSIYLEEHPELQDTVEYVGIPVQAEDFAKDAKNTPAPDPMALLEVGHSVFRSPARARQFNPVWDFPVELLYGDHGKRQGVPFGSVVRLHIVDFDGPQAYDDLGSVLTTMDELLAKPVHTLGPFGSVKKVTLQVDSKVLDPDVQVVGEATNHRLAVPGNAAWTDTNIDVIAGQRIVIEAADEVCSKGGSVDHCSGPEGQRRTSSYNVKGFKKLGHGALIASIGDVRFAVKRRASIVAASSGRLLLGINDTDVKDNRGSYAVRVVVEPLP